MNSVFFPFGREKAKTRLKTTVVSEIQSWLKSLKASFGPFAFQKRLRSGFLENSLSAWD